MNTLSMNNYNTYTQQTQINYELPPGSFPDYSVTFPTINILNNDNDDMRIRGISVQDQQVNLYNDNQNNIDNNDDIMESDGNDIEWDTDLDNDDDGLVIVQDMDPNVQTEIVEVSLDMDHNIDIVCIIYGMLYFYPLSYRSSYQYTV
eukprot:339657_1